jgi:hypothetical protein
MGSASLQFLKPWVESDPEPAAAFLHELQLELASAHPLHGRKLTVIAHSRAADDVLFRIDDGGVADVHLTWSGHVEQPPWPGHQVYASIEEWVQQVMIPAAHEQQ